MSVLSDEQLMEVFAANQYPNVGSQIDALRAVAEYAIAADRAARAEPVAWVEVIDQHEGPYNFHGLELLPRGKHHLYTAPPAAPVVPEGWKLVPVEPNYDMRKSGIDVEIDYDGMIICMSFEDVVRIYRAMLAASQPEVKS